MSIYSLTVRLKIISLILLSFIIYIHTATAQAPLISSFSPTQAAAGATITINGSNFSGTTAVTFGSTAAASFTIVSATKITAVLAYGTSGNVAVTNASGTGTLAGFYYQSLNRIITDFGGYWSSTLLSPNAVKPDSSHNLLAFGYNNTIYSTGVNDARLTEKGISFSPSSYRALPVAAVSGTNPGGSVYLALAKKVDGSTNVANPSTVSHLTVASVLIDGIRGLDLGTGFTNLPSSANISFKINGISLAAINDAEPDILLTQIAQPVSGNDVFTLTDAAGTQIGNSVTQNMVLLNPFGTYDLDLFNLTPNAPFTLATAYSGASTNTNREIRLVALKLSDFGINAGNYTQVRALKITPSTNSDYAFIAYNTASLNLPPNVSQHTAKSNTTICAGGTAAMEVIATAAAGGTLSYEWEKSTDGGNTWLPVTSGANITGDTTQRLEVTNPTNGDQYRATVTESGSGLSSTSTVFTITVSSPAAPSAVTIAGGASICRNHAIQLTSTVTGGSNLYYQWLSSTSAGGPFNNIAGANSNYYLPDVSATGVRYYRLTVSSGSGCAGTVTSASQTVTVTGIASVTDTSICVGSTATLSATVVGGTISWYAADAGGSALATGSSYTTPPLTSNTVYYVASSGCASDLRQPSTVTMNLSSSCLLPVTYTGITARNEGKVNRLKWKVENEFNIKQYSIERSVDGRAFKQAGTLNAAGIVKYEWLDESPFSGTNYYRVLAIEADGKIKYSNIVSAVTSSTGSISIYPNPVINKILNLSFENLSAGRYLVNIFDRTGRKISATFVDYHGGATSKLISLEKASAKGIYYLSVTGNNFDKKIKLLIE